MPVVSESIGAYSYSLAAPPSSVLGLVGDELAMLQPWMPGGGGVYDVDTLGGACTSSWPIDWWQRNLDNVLKSHDECQIAQSTP